MDKGGNRVTSDRERSIESLIRDIRYADETYKRAVAEGDRAKERAQHAERRFHQAQVALARRIAFELGGQTACALFILPKAA